MRHLERKSSSRISFPMFKWRWDRRYVSSYFCSIAAWVDLASRTYFMDDLPMKTYCKHDMLTDGAQFGCTTQLTVHCCLMGLLSRNIFVVVGATVCGRLWLKELALFFWVWQALEDDQRWADDEKQLQRRIEEVQSKVLILGSTYLSCLCDVLHGHWNDSCAVQRQLMWLDMSRCECDWKTTLTLQVLCQSCSCWSRMCIPTLTNAIPYAHSPPHLVPTCPLCSGGILNL
jgi:hypothetical protein